MAQGHDVRRGVWVMPHGVASGHFHSRLRSIELRARLEACCGAPEGSMLLLYIGRLAPEKNLELLIDTMALLEDSSPGAFHLLVGEGPLRVQLERECARRIPGAACFLGHVADRQRLAEIYANCDVFVHPNSREPFGIAPLEAMSSGLALVAPRHGGVRTYADAANAWLADPTPESFARVIHEVRDNPALRATRQSAARETAENFDWEPITDRYFALYDELHALVRDSRREPRGCTRVLLHRSKERRTMTTRRHFTRFCTAAFLFGRRLLSSAERAPLTWIAQPETIPGAERRYRADAQVMLLGIPFLHRANVGDGSAAWRESVSEDGTPVRLLEFAGRSAPERAGGLNRFGLIQELSRSGEAIYFGLMTSSPEESAAEARQALHSTSKEAWYSAIDGRVSDEGIETTRARFMAAARTSAEQRQGLIDRARRELTAAPKIKTASPGAPPPFLNALAGLLADPRKSETHYAYNGNIYRLQVERSREAKTPGIVHIAGNLRRISGGKPIEFRLWIEEGAAHPLPLRIEYQPKSYLKLTFEAV